jgi:hypothetical protein
MSGCTRERGAYRAGVNARLAGRWSLLLAVLLVSVACGGLSDSGSSPSPDSHALSIPALKLAVLNEVGGRLVYCDPDQFPLAVPDLLESARARLPAIRADRDAFQAILEYEQLSSSATGFTSDEVLAINDDYKQMQAIDLEEADGGFRFSVQAPGEGSRGIVQLSGVVSRSGVVTIEQRAAGIRPSCPICLAGNVRIATPKGEIPVAQIEVGMPVWTIDASGRRVRGVVLDTGHMQAPAGHMVVRLELSDGRTVTASPGHPLAGAGTIGGLAPGERYDGAVVTGATLVRYAGTTWDLVPSGPSGIYFADGVPLASTLSPVAAPFQDTMRRRDERASGD